MKGLIRTVPILLAALILTGCPDMFVEGMNNPVDPEADAYQGYETVSNADDISSNSQRGAQWVIFTASEVDGATAYHLQVTTTGDGAFAAPIVDDASFSTNVMAPTGNLIANTTYRWRARAQKGGAWGAWSEAATAIFADTAGMSPADGASTTDTTPTLSWDAVDGADRYEVQIAETAAGVPSATPVTVNAPVRSYTWPTALSAGDKLYWRVKAVAAGGTEGAYSSIASVTKSYGIGDTGPAGGIVFYDKGSYSGGWRYLEAAPSDIDVSGDYTHVWGGYGTSVGGTGTAVGTGQANTTAIVAKYGTSDPYNYTGNYAARLCDQYSYGGYNDWFLPSKDELNLMYQNRGVIGGFAAHYYWSSSEYRSSNAWYQYFYFGSQYYGLKSSNLRVRACRAF